MSVLLTDAEAEAVMNLMVMIERSGVTRPAAYHAIAENIRRKLARKRADNNKRESLEHRARGA